MQLDAVEHQNAEPSQTIENGFAKVLGELVALPDDLYIPPDALEVFLEAFEGPLDLLLYLIKKQNIDILNIPILEITKQYMKYVELMKHVHLELAADYLVMSAMLAEIKSRMLLPRPKTEEEEELDPRAELVRRLQEYERFKKAAVELDALPQVGRDVFPATANYDRQQVVSAPPVLDLQELLDSMRDVLKRGSFKATHMIEREPLSVRERMGRILSRLTEEDFVSFYSFYTQEESRMGVVVTFLAMGELLKERLIDIVQTENFGPIHIKRVTPCLN